MVAHNWIGFVLIANFFLWLGFYLFTDKIKVYHPELSPAKYFRASFRQLQFYGYGIFRGDPNPHHVSIYHKFNPLQSMTYQIIMLLVVPVQFFTGVLLWDVTRFSSIVEMFGGFENLVARRRLDVVAAGEDAGNGHLRHAALAGDILHGGAHIFT